MESNFPTCLKIILKEEGGNDDDPRDHGGRTSRGIIQREWDSWRQKHPERDLPSDVWQAPQAEINAIYKEQYWNPYCNFMPSGLDLVFFNTSVNSGRQQAVKELQRGLGVNADGMMGIITREAIDSCEDIKGLIQRVCDYRRNFYRNLKQFSIYGKGWMARTDRVEKAALGMVSNKPYVEPVGEAWDQTKKAPPTEAAKPPVSKEVGTATTAGTSALSAILEQLQQLSTMLHPYQDTIRYVKYAVIGIAVVSAGLTIYAIWHNAKVKEAMG